MRVLKIAGVVVLGLWMAWMSWMVGEANYNAQQACFYAAAAVFMPNKPPPIGGGCPSYR
jgi:hypothetical protein